MSTTLLLTAALLLGLFGLVAGVLALRTLAKLRASVRVLNRSLGRESFVEVQAHHMQLATDAARGVNDVRARLDSELASMQTRLAAAIDALRADLDTLRGEHRAAADAHQGGAVDIETGRAALAAEAQAVQAQFERARAQLLEEVATQRDALGADQRSAQELMRAALEEVGGVVNASLRRVALVRFDAFDDLSGRLSFCLALLDGRGDGIALTSLAGQHETRLYARPITAGSAELELIPEEKQAVRAALAV